MKILIFAILFLLGNILLSLAMSLITDNSLIMLISGFLFGGLYAVILVTDYGRSEE